MNKLHFSASGLLRTIFRTSHYLHRQFEAQLAEDGSPLQLTGPRLRVLAAVAEAGRIRISELAPRLGIHPRTVTQYIDALEKENFLIRLPDPEDRRAALLQVTEESQPYVEKIRKTMDEAAEKVIANIPLNQQKQLMILLFDMIDSEEERNSIYHELKSTFGSQES